MSYFNRRKLIMGGAALGVVGLSSTALGNGDSFFSAHEIPGQPQFVYFGNVKDTNGGYVQGVAVITEVLEPQITYIAYTNILGRYRTLDIGRAIVELGFEVDQTKIVVTVSSSDYTVVRRMNRGSPRAKMGAVELNFIVAKNTQDVAKSGRP